MESIYPQIFLSHAGHQSVVTHILYDELRRLNHNSVFFDKKSLRLGDSIPEILDRLNHARVAVVIICKTFVVKKWPMMELEHIMEALDRRVKLMANPELNAYTLSIIPVFRGLKPDDLTNEAKLTKWSIKWRHIAEKNRNKSTPLPLNIDKWTGALEKLKSFVGCIISSNPAESNNLFDEIRQVVSQICYILPPPVYNFDSDSFRNVGCKRMAKKIHQTLQKIEKTKESVQDNVMLGVYGVAGSGKTVLSQAIADFYVNQYGYFNGRSCQLELPSEDKDHELLRKRLKKILKTLTSTSGNILGRINNLDQAVTVFKERIRHNKVFLAIDNVRDWSKHYVAHMLNGICAGSWVMITSRSRTTLKFLNLQDIICMPTLDNNEAWEAFFGYIHRKIPSYSDDIKRIANELYSFLDGCHPKLLYVVSNNLSQIEIDDEETFYRTICELREARYLYEDIRKTVVSALSMDDKDLTDEKLKSILSNMAILFPISDVETDVQQCNHICTWCTEIGSKTSEPMESRTVNNFAIWRINADDLEDNHILKLYRIAKPGSVITKEEHRSAQLSDPLINHCQILDECCNMIGNVWGINGASHEVYSKVQEERKIKITVYPNNNKEEIKSKVYWGNIYVLLICWGFVGFVLFKIYYGILNAQ